MVGGFDGTEPAGWSLFFFSPGREGITTNRTEGLNEAFMVSCFIAGLKDEIRLDGSKTEEENIDPETTEEEEEYKDHKFLETGESPEISLHAISGSLAPQTMRVRGSIGRQPVVVLIDNFIDSRTARMAIYTEGTLELVSGGGYCKEVNISI